jgi:hypothetical protein
MGVIRNTRGSDAWKIFVSITEGKRQLGKSKRRSEKNNTEMGWGGVSWIHLAQDRD